MEACILLIVDKMEKGKLKKVCFQLTVFISTCFVSRTLNLCTKSVVRGLF